MSEIHHCLICGSSATRSIAQRSASDLCALWQHLGRPVTIEDLSRCHCEGTVHLYQCSNCGFSFFNPSQAGDGVFYEKLSVDDGTYYNNHRPEFDHALLRAQAKGHRKVLDIGCGSGNYLDLARAAGLETSGMELNAKAAHAAQSKGHILFEGLLDSDFANQHAASFDMVTLFQVVEHLPDPIGLLRLARKLLRPGGTLMFSVPNCRGLYQFFPLDPHQWPPHHISRWRTEDFAHVAKNIGMIHVMSAGDVLHGGSILDFHLRNNEAKKLLGRKSSPVADILVRSASFMYRALRLKHVTRNLGLSIYCCLEQPLD